MIVCLKREPEKRKREGTLVSLTRRKERDCKEERSPVSYPLLPHLCFVPGSMLGTEAEWKVAPVLGIHGLMGEAIEGCRASEAAMRLTAFSVGARRASCGRCHATKPGDARLGTEMEGRPPLQGGGYRDNASTHGGLKSSPEFVKPWHSKQRCLSAFFYSSTRARDKRCMSTHHPARPEPPRPQGPREEEAAGTPGGPASPTCRKHLAIPTLHRGPGGERCAASTSVPGAPAARPVLRRLGGAQHPRVPDMRWAGSPPPARIICSAAPLPAAAAPALPGAQKAGIRCYHNKLNCSQQGPGK